MAQDASSSLAPNKRLLGNDGKGHDPLATAELVSKNDCVLIAEEAVRKQGDAVQGLMQKSFAVFTQGMEEHIALQAGDIREEVDSMGTCFLL